MSPRTSTQATMTTTTIHAVSEEIRGMKRAIGVGVLALGLAALGGCNGDSAKAEETAAAPQPMIVSPENVALAEQAELQAGPTLSGSLTPEKAAQVRAEINGTVLSVEGDQGMRVRAGQVLARIEDAALRDAFLGARAGMRTAENGLQLARRNAERADELFKAGAIAEREAEQARLNLASAEGQAADARARLAQAQQQLGRATVQAPFAGVVGTADVSEGDVVSPGTLLFTVVDPASLRLEASVPATDVGIIKVGMPVQFGVSGLGTDRFEGRITRVSPVVDPATRQVRIVASIPNVQGRLLAGLFAEGRVATESHTGVVVPQAAVDVRGLRPVVRRLKGGKVERVEVATGLTDPATERMEITSGVTAGDTVLLGAAAGIPAGTPAVVRRIADQSASQTQPQAQSAPAPADTSR